MSEFRDKGKGSTNRGRNTLNRQPRKSFLIVCEGKKTEPNYFRSFRVSVRVKFAEAAGNTLSLVKRAKELASEDEYDQVWCVFDKDSFPDDNFDNAIHSAKAAGFEVAYSNEAFELWYLLHYEYYSSSMPRTSFESLLTKHMGRDYKKNDPNIMDYLKVNTQVAIDNAKRLLARADYVGVPYSKQNPSTTVHLLVEELLNNSAP